MRRDLTLYALLMLMSFTMGLFTCRTCTPGCPPCLEPLDGGRIVQSDTVVVIKRDSVKTRKVEPVRITLPTMAAGRAPSVIYKPVPVYMPADSAAYRAIYDDYTALKEYDNSYPFGSDTVRIKQAIQGNDLWEQNVYLTRSYPTITTVVRPKPRNQVWWGASSYWRAGELGVGSSLLFVHKRGIAFEAGAGIGTSGEPVYQGGVKWKIGRK